MEKKIFSKGGPLSTGFHDVICIVLLLCHLSYLFATSPFSFINGFNKASVTFISQVWCPKRGNRNMHKNKHEVRAKNSWFHFLAKYVILHLASTSMETLTHLIRKRISRWKYIFHALHIKISIKRLKHCVNFYLNMTLSINVWKCHSRNIIVIIIGQLKTNIVNIRSKYFLPQVL